MRLRYVGWLGLLTAILIIGSSPARGALVTVEAIPINISDPGTCIFGPNSCSDNLLVSSSVTLPPPGVNNYFTTGVTGTGDEVAPWSGTVEEIRDAVGNTFNIAVDINTSDQNTPHVLDQFEMWIAGNMEYNLASATNIPVGGFGSNAADAWIKSFDLTTFTDTDAVEIRLAVTGASQGVDEFFFVAVEGGGGGGGVVGEIPEPSTVILVGAGLALLALSRVRRRRVQP